MKKSVLIRFILEDFIDKYETTNHVRWDIINEKFIDEAPEAPNGIQG